MTMHDLHFEALNQIGAVASADAFLHGLWEVSTKAADEMDCATLIQGEAIEAVEAVKDPAHYREELADVVIMTLSAAAYLGIDIGAEVQRKMLINQGRPYKHGKS